METGEGSGLPAKCAFRLARINAVAAVRDSGARPATCGVTTTLSHCSSSGRRGGTLGSPSRTDIQASPRNVLRAQRVDQGLGIHDRPAPDVDEIAVRAERGEHVRVDEVLCPRAPRRGGEQKGHLIRQAQAVVVPSTESDLGMVSGRKHDPFGNQLAGVEQRVLHRTVLRMTWLPSAVMLSTGAIAKRRLRSAGRDGIMRLL